MVLSGDCKVCGIATTVTEAVKLGNAQHPDLAILYMRLANGGRGTNIMPLLTECGRIGLLYASGGDIASLTVAQGDVGIHKPYAAHKLLDALKMVQQIVAGGVISRPVPLGVHVLC